MRVIDADRLKEHIDKLPALPDGNFAGNHSALKALINMQPTVDAVPVRHGRWKTVEDWDGDEHYQCSVCGAEFVLIDGDPDDNDYLYCPHCGARMDGKDGDTKSEAETSEAE